MDSMGGTPRRWRLLPSVALASALFLLLAGFLLAVQGERLYQDQKAREIGTQAQILAASVVAALVFEDEVAAQDYVNPLAANPDLRVAGIYGADGRLLAGFARSGEVLPDEPGSVRGPILNGNDLKVVVPVIQNGKEVGAVLLRSTIDPAFRRLVRYGAVVVLAVMAALLVVVLGAAQATMNRANATLASQARDLAAANRNLQLQIEEREKAEQALRQTQKMEALGQLTGGVAHDFNNLLQSLSGCLSLVRRRVDNQEVHKILDAGRQAVERGAKLTQQLLVFARRQALRPQPVDVRDQLLGMSELLARALRADIRLEPDLASDLWTVEVDPTQFELAILNLSVNARDAMPKAGLLRIEARNIALPSDDPEEPALSGEFVRIAVRDDGTGMTPEVQARAFDPFFTTKSVGKGSGLGLSQVYGFVQQSGGAARIETMPGQGTAVILYLPRSHKKPDVQPPVEERKLGRAQGRILLVEDDPIVSSLVGTMLEDLGYRIARAGTADEAMQMIASGFPADLLLSDVIMPGRATGLDLARDARRRRPELPIVLMTGYSEEIAGGTEFTVLSKPYTLDALVTALERAAPGPRRDAGPMETQSDPA